MKTNNRQYLPPLPQQGNINACAEHALVTAASLMRLRAGLPDEQLSRMYPFVTTQADENLVGTELAPSSDGVARSAQTRGLPPERAYGYNIAQVHYPPDASVHVKAAAFKLVRWADIPVDKYNPVANGQAIRDVILAGGLVALGFRVPRGLEQLYYTDESEHLAITNAYNPNDTLFNHKTLVFDFDDNFMGQGLGFRMANWWPQGWGNGSNELVFGPQFLRCAIQITAYFGFTGCADRFTYDADGIPGQVYRLYRAAFDRLPDKQGMGYHIDNMARGVTLADVASQFIASPEFQSKYGALGNRAFVELLYRNVLHRPGDAGGIDFHTANLDAGRTARHDTLVSFSASPEYYAKTVAVFEAGVAYT